MAATDTPPHIGGRPPHGEAHRLRPGWATLLALLLLLRLPSLVQPAGGDQGLYGYSGAQIVRGGVMYRDMWDQKPPAIAALYSVLWRFWPTQAIVPAADLAAAALTACLLVILGRRRYADTAGWAAAAMFLLLGDPYLQRLGGVFVRGQCEPFINVAIASGVVLLSGRQLPRWRLFMAGLTLSAAFWLKYNAAAYALVLAAALWARQEHDEGGWRSWAEQAAWIAGGFVLSAALVVGYFAVKGSVRDLYYATIAYNLGYSNETYHGPLSVLGYLITVPMERARADMLWYTGGIGAVLLSKDLRTSRWTLVAYAWLAAAILSIAINGSRDLPNYFVQAAPPLALAGAAGLMRLPSYRLLVRYAVIVLLALGVWRVGTDTEVFGMRLASMPGLAENVRFDARYLMGRMDRDTYLARFSGKKHNALENARLVDYVDATTTPDESIFVFGFSGGSVCWLSQRQSASRFFWSMPIIREFKAGTPGYGSAGLLRDLERSHPAIVALQKEEWRSGEFFMRTPPLRQWLEANYTPVRETDMFSVWRRTR